MPRIQARNIDIHYEDVGQGAAVLLLGGTLGTAQGDFFAQLAGLGADLRIIAPERRGYGATRPPARDYPDDFYQRDAHDMAAFMDALALPAATVLGWSEGADVALCLASLYPHKLARLVVWGGISKVEDEDLAMFEARRDVASWPAKACALMNAAYEASYWPATWGQWCDTMARLHAQGGDVRLAPLSRIACPVLIVHGGRDALIRSEHPRNLERQIAGARLHEIAGGGHNLHLSHADEFNALVRRFIDTTARAAAS